LHACEATVLLLSPLHACDACEETLLLSPLHACDACDATALLLSPARVPTYQVLADTSFRTLRRAQKNLTSVEVSQLPAVPISNRTVLVSLIHVWESTALLGDLVLRLPDIMHLQVR
jgi:hypothetical protein